MVMRLGCGDTTRPSEKISPGGREEAVDYPSEVALCSFRSGREAMPQRVTQRGGGWKRSESFNAHIHNVPQDARVVYVNQQRRKARVLFGAKHSSSCIEATWSWSVSNGLLPLGVSVVRDYVC